MSAANCSGSGSSGTGLVAFPAERFCSGSQPVIREIPRCQLYGPVVAGDEFLVVGIPIDPGKCAAGLREKAVPSHGALQRVSGEIPARVLVSGGQSQKDS